MLRWEMAVVKKAKKKKSNPNKVDPKKERIFKTLVELFPSFGYQVRREELKRGPGWRASSGCCRKLDEKIVFVDRRSSQEDQIAFLLKEILALGLTESSEAYQALDEEHKGDLAKLLGKNRGPEPQQQSLEAQSF